MAVTDDDSDRLQERVTTEAASANGAQQLPPRWRNEVVARTATQVLSRLLALVTVPASLLAATFAGPTGATSYPAIANLADNGLPGAILALLTPAVAGLAGAVLLSRARHAAAGEAQLLAGLPGTPRFLDTNRVGRAARASQIAAVAGPSAGLAVAAWFLGGVADAPPPSSAVAGSACIALALLAYPLLIGERVLANTDPQDLPEASDLRALLLLAVLGLPLSGLLLLALAGGVTQARFGLVAVAGFSLLVTTELGVRALLRAFLPLPREDEARAACRSLLATLLADGTRPGGVSGSIRRNLGIDFARSWALSFVRTALPPVVLTLAALTWAMTGLVVVGPDQRAVVETFGRPSAVLQPGLHLALPWPAAHLRVVDNGATRETSLSGEGGSTPAARARADDRAVPEADRLWQETHASERLFLIASETGDAQSFQAVGADIRLIWRVGPTNADVLRYAYTTSDPQRRMVAIAGRTLEVAFASETLTSVLGENRAALAAGLKRTIQAGIDQAGLGITLVAVVIEAMHPPTGAASAFHAVQAAEITARTSIAAEQGNALAARAQAQTNALETVASATSTAGEVRAAAVVALTGFRADQQAARAGGATFAFERYLSNLTAAGGRMSLTVLDHRIAAAQAPTIDLRYSGGSELSGH